MTTIYSELLGYIHKYYSIGMPGLFDYPGDAALKSIVEAKINSLINEEQTPWSAFIKSLGGILEGRELRDFSFLQFPNYVCYIEMGNQESQNVHIKTNLVIVLSLLCDYYTFFFEDLYTMKSYQLADPSDSPGFAVVSFDVHSGSETYRGEMVELKELIATNFSNYSYLHHKLLFKNHISGGVPYGEALSEVPISYSIYRYLFNSYSYFTPFEVLD